ncbi:proteinric peroxidase [Desmophyllum pertusum]|uniref:Proteinric peroxidase n=1 Tax=Desmophyllum pertusum TaxID=174260 RepID=A0A9X0D606_9CNID|nr:proteinric peroxidase [Desmophyllum pertusum]
MKVNMRCVLNTKDITGETRTVFHVTPNQVSAQNDGDMNAIHWHRFIDHMTSKPMQLPDSCQDPLTCGTQATGWLRGGHPSPEDYAVLRTVCFSWNGNCCFAEVQAHVRHCYGYYVYKLQPTTFGVKARYCTENSAIDHKAKDALFYHTPSNDALEDHVIHLEYHVNSSWKCMVYCLVEKTCVSFNYHPHSGACEINNSTGLSSPDSLRERPGIEYYEKM